MFTTHKAHIIMFDVAHMYKVHLSDTQLKHLVIAHTSIRPHLKLFQFVLSLPCLETLGRYAGFFYELLYYALFLSKELATILSKLLTITVAFLCFSA